MQRVGRLLLKHGASGPFERTRKGREREKEREQCETENAR